MTDPDDGSTWAVRAIGFVSSPRTEAIDDDWGAVESTITLEAPFGPSVVARADGRLLLTTVLRHRCGA